MELSIQERLKDLRLSVDMIELLKSGREDNSPERIVADCRPSRSRQQTLSRKLLQKCIKHLICSFIRS